MKKRIYIIILFCIAAIPMLAQNMQVSGVITEADTKDPLIGVTIQIKGTTSGTVSDLDGQYTINVDKGKTLVFSQIGMKKQEIKVTSSQLDIVMEEDAVMLDQVVVIGYGSVQKSHLSGAVNSISSEKMNAEMFTSLGSALQGKVPGVSVSSSDGNPMNGPNIVIRGVNSLVNNAPLYVIDGAYRKAVGFGLSP